MFYVENMTQTEQQSRQSSVLFVLALHLHVYEYIEDDNLFVTDSRASQISCSQTM